MTAVFLAVCGMVLNTWLYWNNQKKLQEEQMEKQSGSIRGLAADIASLEVLLESAEDESAALASQMDWEQRLQAELDKQAEDALKLLLEASCDMESLQLKNEQELLRIKQLQRELERKQYEASVAASAEASRQESIAASAEASRQESIAASAEASRQESIAASAEASRQESIAASIEAARPESSAAVVTPPVSGKTVYITFDDGPSYLTEQVLDILDEYGVKATFFVTYQPQYENMYREIVKRGHTIGIHTASHVYKTIYASFDNWLADFRKVYDYVYHVTGVYPMVYRFPGGSTGPHCNSTVINQAIAFLKSIGMEYFDWNAVNGDGGTVTAQQSYEEAIKTTLPRKHPVLLMHDAAGKETTAASLPGILKKLKECGYNFGTLSPQVPPIHQGSQWDY